MNKVLVVTGASKGIGLAAAKLFAKNNYKVINLSRGKCPVAGAVSLQVDLLDYVWPEQWQGELLKEVGEPVELVIVHSAGMLTKDTVATIEAEVLRQVLQLNVVAAAQLNKLLIPKMQEGSSLLYISTTLGTKAVANTHAYVVSKHAVIGQMRATCQDLAGKGIHTACVCPGFTETEMLQNHLKTNPELYDQLASRMALKRLAQPSEIADTLWFCSQNPVINGSVIHANLGQIEQ